MAKNCSFYQNLWQLSDNPCLCAKLAWLQQSITLWKILFEKFLKGPHFPPSDYRSSHLEPLNIFCRMFCGSLNKRSHNWMISLGQRKIFEKVPFVNKYLKKVRKYCTSRIQFFFTANSEKNTKDFLNNRLLSTRLSLNRFLRKISDVYTLEWMTSNIIGSVEMIQDIFLLLLSSLFSL